MNLQVYRDIEDWKKPLHLAHAYLAKIYLKFFPNTQVIGITGSVGKTLTQNAVCSILSQKYKVVCGDENLDPTFRIPQTILKAKPWHKFIILEYGVEHPHDMDHYLSVAKAKIAVVTNIAPTHTKYFKSEKGVFEEKAKLVKALPSSGAVFLNANDKWAKKMAQVTSASVNWFQKSFKKGLKISNFYQDYNGSRFLLSFLGEKVPVSWKIVGKHQLLSAYAAAAVGVYYHLTLNQIAQGLSAVEPPIRRLNVIRESSFTILDDTYNSSPKAARESIETLLDLGANQQKIAVLGEMKDLGDLSEAEHKSLGKFISSTNISYLITIGKVAGLIGKSAQGANFKGKVFNCLTTQESFKELKKVITKNSLILVKGSRHSHLERVVLALQGKHTQISCYHCGNLK